MALEAAFDQDRKKKSYDKYSPKVEKLEEKPKVKYSGPDTKPTYIFKPGEYVVMVGKKEWHWCDKVTGGLCDGEWTVHPPHRCRGDKSKKKRDSPKHKSSNNKSQRARSSKTGKRKSISLTRP